MGPANSWPHSTIDTADYTQPPKLRRCIENIVEVLESVVLWRDEWNEKTIGVSCTSE